jgi:hypothetical protein
MDRALMGRQASSAPTTGVRVEPARGRLQIPPALQLSMEARRGSHKASLAITRTLPPEGPGKETLATTMLLAPAEAGLQLPVKCWVRHY